MACGNRRAFLSGRFRPPAKPPASGREGPALPPAAGFCPEMSLETAINKCAARCRPSFPPNRFSESGTLRKEDGIGTLLSESPRPGHGKLANIAVHKSFHCTIRRTGYAIFRLRKTLFFGKSGGPGIVRGLFATGKRNKKGDACESEIPFRTSRPSPRNGKEFGYSVFSLMALATSSSFIPLDALIKTKVLANRLAFK